MLPAKGTEGLHPTEGQPLPIVAESTGRKVCDKGEWRVRQRSVGKCKATWWGRGQQQPTGGGTTPMAQRCGNNTRLAVAGRRAIKYVQ